MKQLRYLALALLCIAALFAGCEKNPTRPEKAGSLTVNSVPNGAVIWLDNASTGKATPAVFNTLLVGCHKLSLYLADYEPWQDSVCLEKGKDAVVNAVLKPHTGAIHISSEPSGAAISLDGSATGKQTPTTLLGVPVGYHALELQLEGYSAWMDTVRVGKDSVTVISASFQEPGGTLAVNSEPAGATIWLDGVNTGFSTPHTFLHLSVGLHSLKLTLADFQDWTGETVIASLQTTSVEASLVSLFGSLQVTSVPSVANIFLDGDSTGFRTPSTFSKISTGEHFVLLRKSGYLEWQDTVLIEPGQTAYVHGSLQLAPCIIGDTTQTPTITITSQPGECPYGDWASGSIVGQANNVFTERCFVALYAETDNFYAQPTVADRRTSLSCGGSFTALTHCGHHYNAILAKNSWDPPATMVSLPEIGGEILAIDREPERQILFAGETWIVKSSRTGKIDPGPNYWSDASENVWVDGNGRLHLKLTLRNGEWYCPEIYNSRSLGYGEYTFYTDSRVDQHDVNVIFACFLYEYLGKEIDIEFSRWGDPSHNNSQYVVQPWGNPGNLHSFNAVLADRLSAHRIVWTAEGIEFASWRGHSPTPPPANLIQHWHYTGADNPPPGKERARFNVWLLNGQPPVNRQELEIIVTNFTWRQQPGQNYGSLTVNSDPPGAAIWLDGVNTNLTAPQTFPLVSAGQHQVKLTLADYQDWIDTVAVATGQNTAVNAKLAAIPAYGKLAVASTPPGAVIWLDSVNTGYVTPRTLTSLLPKTYQVRLTLAGYRDWNDTVEVKANQTTTVAASLEVAPPILIVTSVPTGIEVWLNGTATGKKTPATFTNLVAGTYSVRLLLARNFPYDTALTLSNGQTKTVHATFTPAPLDRLTYTVKDTIYQTSLDGINPSVLATDYKNYLLAYVGYNGILRWSPDGQRLAYTSQTGVSILLASGSKEAEFTFASGKRTVDLSWSHDSRYLIFGAYVDGIYRYDTATKELKRIMGTGCYCYDHNPVYSPGDSVIAFIHQEYGSYAYLYLMNASGGNVRLISNRFSTGFDEDINLAWLNAHQLLFKTSTGLYRLDLNGFSDTTKISPQLMVSGKSDLMRISQNQSSFAHYLSSAPSSLQWGAINDWVSRVVVQPVAMYDFCWSPNGQALAYRNDNGLYWTSLDGKKYLIINYPSAGRGSVASAP